MNVHVKELLDYLEYSFEYYNNQNVFFKVKDKYLINIHIHNKNINISKYELDYSIINSDLILSITEDLLVELYKNGITLSNLLKKIKDGSIKTEKFKLYKFITFVKNFDFSPDKWNEFIIFYKKN